MLVAALHYDPCPAPLLRAWEWFWILTRKRQVAVGMGAVPQPLTYTELDSWCRYTGNRPSFIERRAIDVFDQVYLEVMK